MFIDWCVHSTTHIPIFCSQVPRPTWRRSGTLTTFCAAQTCILSASASPSSPPWLWPRCKPSSSRFLWREFCSHSLSWIYRHCNGFEPIPVMAKEEHYVEIELKLLSRWTTDRIHLHHPSWPPPHDAAFYIGHYVTLLWWKLMLDNCRWNLLHL